ncbi:MAG: uroporphyrinogen decarboxylase [Alphaproteobacteria bacterium]|nr:MAG: uroporphyrinogen decarboxylase [Alphaproteobacteria bacterium]
MKRQGQSTKAVQACDRNCPILDVLSGIRRSPVPLWFMRQAGRYLPEYRRLRERAGSFLDLVHKPDLAAEVTLQPVERFGLDAAILFSDILVVPHALGQELAFLEGEGPRLEPIADRKALARLVSSRAEETLQPIYETVRRVKAALPPKVALIGFAGGPWTVASYMIAGRGGDEQRAAKLWAYSDPEGFGMLIDRLVEATIAYLEGQIAAGADAIQIFESWAAHLPEPWFSRLVIEPTRRIVAALARSAPGIPVIGFARGGGTMLEAYARQSGVSAVSLDSGTSLAVVDAWLPKGMAVQGNLDPLLVCAGGREMRQETRRILRALERRPHIFNLGHGFVPETPPEHVAELVAFVREESGGA